MFTDKYNDFIDANRIEDAEERLKTMKKLVCVKAAEHRAGKNADEYLLPLLHSCLASHPSLFRSMTFQTTTITP